MSRQMMWDVAKFKIMFAAYQILASVRWVLELTLPEPFASFHALLSRFFNISLLQVGPLGGVQLRV